MNKTPNPAGNGKDPAIPDSAGFHKAPCETSSHQDRAATQGANHSMRNDPLHIQAKETQAGERDAEASRAVLDLASSLEASTGYPIQIVFEDLPLEADAYVEVAPLARLDCHVVHCTPFLSRPIYLHVLAHELTHIHLDHQALAAGKAREFLPSARSRRYISGLYLTPARRFRRQGWSHAEIEEAVQADAGSLLMLLYNCPVDLVVELWLSRHYPCLSAAQFLALYRLHQRDVHPRDNPSQDNLRPRQLDICGLALDCVRALLHDEICAPATAFAAPYRDTEVFPLALRLWQHWKAVSPSLGPGDEFRLVDTFADILGLRQAYESRTQAISARRPLGPPQGASCRVNHSPEPDHFENAQQSDGL